MDTTLLVERDRAIATVILNRPEKLNALTRPMWRHFAPSGPNGTNCSMQNYRTRRGR